MLGKAIDKLRSEMEKENNDPYIQLIGDFLLQKLDENPAIAEKILADDKTISKSIDEMAKEARKKANGNRAILTDEEGFGIVLKYYQIDDPSAAKSYTPKAEIEPSMPVPGKKTVEFDVKLEDLLL